MKNAIIISMYNNYCSRSCCGNCCGSWKIFWEHCSVNLTPFLMVFDMIFPALTQLVTCLSSQSSAHWRNSSPAVTTTAMFRGRSWGTNMNPTHSAPLPTGCCTQRCWFTLFLMDSWQSLTLLYRAQVLQIILWGTFSTYPNNE